MSVVAYLSDRIKAATARVPDRKQDKEAFAVLALNNAAARSRKGRFYYLPESREPPEIHEKQHQPVITESVVPRLLYVDHEWTNKDCEDYWQGTDDGNRHTLIQEDMSAKLHTVNVIPINLVIQTSSISYLSWPAKFLASVVIYGPGPWYKLSWMSEWTEKATANKARDTYTVPMFHPGAHRQKRDRYKQSVNFVGNICGLDELPSDLRAMLRLSVDEVKESEDVAPKSRAISQQSAGNESKEYNWVAGVDVLELLALEAMKVKGGSY